MTKYLKRYICRCLKNLHWKYIIALFALVPMMLAPQFFSAQVDSAIELLADSTSWMMHQPNTGGDSEEEETDRALFNEEPAGLFLETISDSLAHIPAFDLYCSWDTKNLFAEKNALDNVGGGVRFQLCYSECDFVYPASGDITSPFGPRWGRMHNGMDIDLESGDMVNAAFEGMVRISQYNATYGNVVVIRHNNGLETLYAHLSQRKVKPGDHVEAGSLIGLGGNTGRSYGSHLHFEVRYMGEPIDPNLLVDPSRKSLRDWEFVLDKKHFECASIDPKALEARRGTKSTVSKYHVVRKGDTLSAIARKYSVSVDVLCKLNKVKKSTTLRLGQKIRFK